MVTAFADYAAIYTVRSWVFGWLSRVLIQVTFFALIGHLLGSRETGHFLLVGNAVMMASFDSLFVIHSTVWERRAGTLPLLVSAPTSSLLVFAGRSVHWIASGTTTAVISLFGLGALFEVPIAIPGALVAIPLVLLISLSTYCFGLTLGGLVLRAITLRSIVSNFAQLCMLAFCGVQVPTSFWPTWLEHLTEAMPLTHGLVAVRMALQGGPAGQLLGHAALEAAVGIGWLVTAALVFDRLAERGRRDGSIEFGD